MTLIDNIHELVTELLYMLHRIDASSLPKERKDELENSVRTLFLDMETVMENKIKEIDNALKE